MGNKLKNISVNSKTLAVLKEFGDNTDSEAVQIHHRHVIDRLLRQSVPEPKKGGR